VAKYIQIMKHLAEDSRGAVQFWSTHYLALPLLFSIVKRILPVRPCSTDIERLFSLTSRTCPLFRSNLSVDMVNKQACFKILLNDSYYIAMEYSSQGKKIGIY
jgi:hypothetical protein